MATRGINFKFNGETTLISNYNSGKTNMGTLIQQYSGLTPIDTFCGPMKIGMGRPGEANVAISSMYPHAISITPDLDWVFLADNATVAINRRIVLYEYTKSTSTFNWIGYITTTFPSNTATYTIKGLRVSRELYTTGTVSGTGGGNTIAGSSSLWSSDRMSVGCRIGFGSTDPTQITTWYEISAIGSNTSITLTNNLASTLNAGTPYVIEDLMILLAVTNTTNGGLFVIKGIRRELFAPGLNASLITHSTSTVDNQRLCYWLADASTVTNTVACGCAIGTRTSWTDQRVYVIDTNTRCYVYNFRQALSLTSGKDTTTNIIKTGLQAFTGTVSQTNNGRVGTLNHGVTNGVECLYFVTNTRVYAAPISGITAGSTTWMSSNLMLEIPPGGTSTYVAAQLSSVEIANDIDRLVIMSIGTAGVRSYVTKFNVNSEPFDHIFLIDDKQLDQSIADSGGVIHPAIQGLPFSVWSQNGVLYLIRGTAVNTTAVNNQIYSLPIGAHQTYAFQNNQLLITPVFDVSDYTKLYGVSVNFLSKLGTDTFSLAPEPFKLYYRTTGLDTYSSSGWNLVDESGDLTGISADYIQFAFSFRILGTACIPARILGLNLVYEDNKTDSHYEPSIGNSSVSNNIFAYRQKSKWGSTIPTLQINFYNSSDILQFSDNTLTSTNGVFQYSTNNGSSWSSWSNSADAVGNYIRYSATTSFTNGIKVRAVLTQKK